MSPREFWHEYSYSDLQRRMFYHYKRIDDKDRGEWERLRMLIGVTLGVNGSKTKAMDVLPLPWDDEREEVPAAKPMTDEEVQRILKQYKIWN